MNNAEIQIQFPEPGIWTVMSMSAVYADADGFNRVDTYTQDTLPPEQIPALEAAITAIATLEEDWWARQVWARLVTETIVTAESVESVETILLTVEAINKNGGTRMFRPSEYEQFRLTDTGSLSFFKYFTTKQPSTIYGDTGTSEPTPEAVKKVRKTRKS